jgi:hypothetical protein
MQQDVPFGSKLGKPRKEQKAQAGSLEVSLGVRVSLTGRLKKEMQMEDEVFGEEDHLTPLDATLDEDGEALDAEELAKGLEDIDIDDLKKASK